jgi:CRISPR-associated endonuclease/helicase Cas3
MVSEMAPLDLLLQRTGRLHRHPRGRPRGLDHPTLWLLAPEVADDLPRFDAASTYVYAEHVLLRSWLALRSRMHAGGELTIAIPSDVSDLIEEAYDNRDAPAAPPQLVKVWEQTLRKLQGETETLALEASVRRLDAPDADDAEPLARYTRNAVEEDDLELHPRFQALTRWGPPNVTVVVLYQQRVGCSLDSGGAHPVDPRRKARDLEEVKALLRHSIPVSTRRLTRHLLQVRVPQGWQESPLLNHCRSLVLDPSDRSTPVGKFRVRLDPDEGLVIEAPSEEKEEPE